VDRDFGSSVHLAYFDDGGKGDVKVFGGVVINDDQYGLLEAQVGQLVERLLPEDRRKGVEFHASDLYVGKGQFEGLDEAARRAVLEDLIGLHRWTGFTYIYSALNMRELRRSPLASASWTDVAFRMCAATLDEWLMKRFVSQLHAVAGSSEPHVAVLALNYPVSLMILDEPEQGERDRQRIRSSFRTMRVQRGGGISAGADARLRYPVDDIFFGSSANSIALQVADACNWAMWRYLCDGVDDRFYQRLCSGTVICAKPEPEWSQLRHLFAAHDEPVGASGGPLVALEPKVSF
jgi:hypothetical protein